VQRSTKELTLTLTLTLTMAVLSNTTNPNRGPSLIGDATPYHAAPHGTAHGSQECMGPKRWHSLSSHTHPSHTHCTASRRSHLAHRCTGEVEADEAILESSDGQAITSSRSVRLIPTLIPVIPPPPLILHLTTPR